MKKIIVIILLSVLVFGIVSCAKEPEEFSKPFEIPTPNVTIPVTTKTTRTTLPVSIQELEPTKREEPPIIVEEGPTDEARFYLGNEKGFFIRETRKTWSTAYEIVNESGVVTYTFEKYEKPIGDLYNGYSLVQFETPGYGGKDRRYFLIDAYGDVVFEDGTDDIYLVGYSRTDDYPSYFFEDGYIFAYRYLESMTDVELELGIMKADGTWQEPLSTKHPIMQVFPTITPENIGNQFEYIGEGMVFMRREAVGYGKYAHYLYDMNTKDFIKMDETFNPPLRRENLFVFKDGVARYQGFGYDTIIKEVKKSGKITEVPIPDRHYVEDYYDKESDSYFYFTIGKDQRLLIMNSKKGEVKKLDDFHKWSTKGFTSDKAQFIVWNAAGTPYYAVIDTKGDYVFEPFVIEDEFRGIADIYGNCLSKRDYDGSRQYLLVSDEGIIIYKGNSMTDIEYRNGVVKRTVTEHGSLVNKYDLVSGNAE